MPNILSHSAPKTLGARLRIIRESAGLSTRDAANELLAHGIRTTHASIANYERGVSQPPTDVLGGLSRVYGRTLESLLADIGVLRGVRYRCLKSVREGEKRRFEGDGQAWLEAYRLVESLLDHPLLNKHSDLRIKRSISGADLARQVRDHRDYGFRDYPLPSAVRLTENFGIRVIQLRTDARIDAFAGWLDDTRVIVLNASLPNDRVRLTVLHELAHHLYEDCLDDSRSLDHDEVEQRAFDFASHLLLPDSQLKAAFELKSMVRLVQYKERFGISLAAMIYRAGKSGLISRQLYERIWRDFSRLGVRKDEPGRVAEDRPVRMESLLDAAIGRGLTTFDQVGEWVGASAIEVQERIVRAMGGDHAPGNLDQDGPTTMRLDDYR